MTNDPLHVPEVDPVPAPAEDRPTHTRDALSRLLVLVGNLGAFIAFVIFSGVVAVAVLDGFGNEESSALRVVVASAALLLATMGFAVAWTKWLGLSVAEGLGLRGSRYGVHGPIAVGVALAPLSMIVSLLHEGPPTPVEKLVSEALFPMAAVAVLVAPLAEETIFRGFLFRIFSDAAGPVFALVLTTAVFAGMHVSQLSGNWLSIGAIFVVGAVLGYLRFRSGSIVPGVIAHCAYNATLFFLGLLISAILPE